MENHLLIKKYEIRRTQTQKAEILLSTARELFLDIQ